MRYLAIVALLLMAGCSIRTIYPGLGATAGGAVGSLGGPAGSGAGALLGWSLGETAKSGEKVDETLAKVEALSKGDVSALLNEQQSTFDKVISGIYDTILICCIVAALWFLIPIIWTKYHVRKKIEDHLGQ
jgi:hypothetical protein